MSKNDLPNHEVVPQVMAEIFALEQDVVAIGTVLVMKDGTVKTKIGFTEGTSLTLLAGVDLFHADVRRSIKILHD